MLHPRQWLGCEYVANEPKIYRRQLVPLAQPVAVHNLMKMHWARIAWTRGHAQVSTDFPARHRSDDPTDRARHITPTRR